MILVGQYMYRTEEIGNNKKLIHQEHPHDLSIRPATCLSNPAPYVSFYRYWHSNLRLLSGKSFKLVGMNPSKHVFDLNSTKLDYLPGLVSNFSTTKNCWEHIDLNAVRLRFTRQDSTDQDSTDQDSTDETRTSKRASRGRRWRRRRLRLARLLRPVPTHLPRKSGQWQSLQHQRPRLLFHLMRANLTTTPPFPERNRSFVTGFSRSPNELTNLFRPGYLTKHLRPIRSRGRTRKPYRNLTWRVGNRRGAFQRRLSIINSYRRLYFDALFKTVRISTESLVNFATNTPQNANKGIPEREDILLGCPYTINNQRSYRSISYGCSGAAAHEKATVGYRPKEGTYSKKLNNDRLGGCHVRDLLIGSACLSRIGSSNCTTQRPSTYLLVVAPRPATNGISVPQTLSTLLKQYATERLRRLKTRSCVRIIRYPELRSYKNTHLTLTFGGIFIPHRPILSQMRRRKLKYRLKKKWYSFLATNQVKKAWMVRKRKIITNRLVLNLRRWGGSRRRFSYTYFNNLHKFVSRVGGMNQMFTSNIFRTNDLFANNTQNQPNYTPHLFTLTRDDIVDTAGFYNKGILPVDRFREVRIPRVKFKPGYQRIWRRVRVALKDNLRLRFVYQQQLTKYLTRFYKSSHLPLMKQSESTLDRVILYSRLLPDLNTLNTFVNKNLVFINGGPVSNLKVLTSPGDLIQLTVSPWYYTLYRWLFNWTNLRNRKFRRLVYRKGRAARYKVMKAVKQRSYYTPNWIHNHNFDISDVKPYLEVDYFSLSATVLYDPYIMDQQPQNYYVDHRVPIYKLYNWKYVN